MSWPTILVIGVTLAYSLTSILYFTILGDVPRATMFAGYAVANLGFLAIKGS
jgi:hypothetical protein